MATPTDGGSPERPRTELTADEAREVLRAINEVERHEAEGGEDEMSERAGETGRN